MAGFQEGPIQTKLEVRNVGFDRGRKFGAPGEKFSEKANNNSIHMTPGRKGES